MASRSPLDKGPAPAASLTLRAASPLPPACPVGQEVLLLDQFDQFDHARKNGVNLRRTSISRTPASNTRTIDQVARPVVRCSGPLLLSSHSSYDRWNVSISNIDRHNVTPAVQATSQYHTNSAQVQDQANYNRKKNRLYLLRIRCPQQGKKEG